MKINDFNNMLIKFSMYARAHVVMEFIVANPEQKSHLESKQLKKSC